jgi:hypothetical protein
MTVSAGWLLGGDGVAALPIGSFTRDPIVTGRSVLVKMDRCLSCNPTIFVFPPPQHQGICRFFPGFGSVLAFGDEPLATGMLQYLAPFNC